MHVPDANRRVLTRGSLACLALAIPLVALANHRTRWGVPDVELERGMTALGMAGTLVAAMGVGGLVVLAVSRAIEPGYGRGVALAALLVGSAMLLAMLGGAPGLDALLLSGALVALSWPERLARGLALVAAPALVLQGAVFRAAAASGGGQGDPALFRLGEAADLAGATAAAAALLAPALLLAMGRLRPASPLASRHP